MATVTIVNATKSQVSNVNLAGIDIPAESIRTGVVLTAAEADALLATAGVFVVADNPTNLLKRAAARIMKYRKTAAGVAI